MMPFSILLRSAACAAVLLVSGTAQASLVPIGAGLVSDSGLNVTWTSDANLFRTHAAGDPTLVSTIIGYQGGSINGHTLTSGDFDPASGRMSWWGQQAWIDYLNFTYYGGYSNWRLPTTVDAPSSLSNDPSPASSEMAHLYFDLGGVVPHSIETTHGSNFDLFTNIEVDAGYWSGTVWSTHPTTDAWNFGFDAATQTHAYMAGLQYALAVRPCSPFPGGGSTGACFPGPGPFPAPEPTNLALVCMGLGCLALISGRRNAQHCSA